MKISNPRLMTRMRNNIQLANNIIALPIIQAPLLINFLTMNFCLVNDRLEQGVPKFLMVATCVNL